MAVAAALPQLATVIATAAIDSINPCAIGVLILMVSTIIATNQSRKRMFLLGMTYIGAVFITYLVAGLGLVFFFTQIPQSVAEYISIFVGSLIVVAGVIEIKDFYWYGQGFTLSIAPNMAKKIKNYSKNVSLPGVAFLGAFVSAVELPCTGAPYLAIILILKEQFDFTAVLLLILYNIIFVLPLIIILVLAMFGTKVSDMKMWKDQNRSYMRLLSGLAMIILGWILIFIANGSINFG
jgi:cytochrome c biogenesis protein CcdA